MDATMKIAVILSAFDRMSSVVNQATDNAEKRMKKLMTKNFAEGGAMMATGVALVKSLQPAVSAYSKLEEANVDLKASMLDASGAVDQNFEKITQLAEQLGDKLPGATADFDALFKTMLENGLKSENILNGVGKAAAFLAVDLKMPFEAAGEFSARMKEATGVADNEMLKFMDTISRLKSLGIGADEMRYAFSRSSGTLKLLGLQGLQASNDMGVLYAQMIRVGGMSGETAGTSFNNIMQNLLDSKKFSKVDAEAKKLGVTLNFFKDGKFLGIENMVAQFGKLSSFDINKRANLVQLLTGGGQDAQAVNTIISQGTAGFSKLRSEMEKKAALNDKVNLKLATLKSLWEATTGTIENMLAALGAGLAPVLKPVVEMIGTVAAKIKEWLSNNPALAKFISMLIATAGIALTLAGVVKIIAGIRIAMQLLNITLMANPFILIAAAAILAISLIYANWGKIRAWFGRLWQGVKNIFSTVWNGIKTTALAVFTPHVLIYRNWSKITAFFSNLWQGVKNVFFGVVTWLKGLGSTFYNAGKNIVMSIFRGIKDFFMYPINKVKDMVGKIRKYLPFSPAKEGPLRDIHKIRLVETIAESIRPNSLVDKMRHVAKLSMGAITGKPGGARSVGAMAGVGGNNTTIHFTVNLNGTATKQDANNIFSEFEKKLPQMLKKYQGQQTRVSFGGV